MFCGTNNSLQNIPHIQPEWFRLLLVPQNIVMDLNNVMMMEALYILILSWGNNNLLYHRIDIREMILNFRASNVGIGAHA